MMDRYQHASQVISHTLNAHIMRLQSHHIKSRYLSQYLFFDRHIDVEWLCENCIVFGGQKNWICGRVYAQELGNYPIRH